MNRCAGKPRLRAWLELVRLPNLFTVPGDPVVGFLIAGAGQSGVDLVRVIPCAAASLFLYSAGIISNDCFDVEEDRRDRPERPLPSGRIQPRTAFIVTMILFALGIGSAWSAGIVPGIVACTLMLAIIIYNALGKRVPAWGPINMGLCRGLSLMLGAAAFGTAGPASLVVLVAAAGLTLYVASVTLIAAKETTGQAPGWVALLPCVVVAVWLVGLKTVEPFRGTFHAFSLSLMILSMAWVALWSVRLRKETEPRKVSRNIGALLQALLLIQAAIAALVMKPGPGMWVALGLLLAMPLTMQLSRRFYAS